ncbi:MAG TPA: hypothetical protein VIT45_15165 [Allosphingosinicella sp.]
MKRPLMLLASLSLLGGAALFEAYALTRQRLQLRVDAAAEHGAHALAEGRSIEAEVRRRLDAGPAIRPGARIEIEQGPSGGRYRGWPNAVRVRVRQAWRPPLVPRGLAARLPLDVAATAVAVPPGPGHPGPVALRVE